MQENPALFPEEDIHKILKTLANFPEEKYEKMERVINHGDVRKGNFKKEKEEPFILDFERICYEYPTFDLSTSIYASPYEATKILREYLEQLEYRKLRNFGKEYLIDAILTDTLRIALYDQIDSNKKGTLEGRKPHNNQVISKLLK